MAFVGTEVGVGVDLADLLRQSVEVLSLAGELVFRGGGAAMPIGFHAAGSANTGPAHGHSTAIAVQARPARLMKELP